MSGVPIHSLARLFPLLDGDQFDALAADIRANGLHEPIVLFEGEILDGRNRYSACIQAGVEPQFSQFEGGYIDAVESVWDWNLKRRHLNSTQAACCNVLRNRLTSDYAKLREEAKARTGGRPPKDKPSQLIDRVSDPPQLIGEGANKHSRETDAVRAEAALLAVYGASLELGGRTSR